MLWRVRDILEAMAPVLQVAGLCHAADVTQLLQAYNRINEILMSRRDWPGTEADVEFVTHEGCLTLPAQFGAITALVADHQVGRILPLGYRYLEGGLGTVHAHSPEGLLQHLGDRFATFADLPQAMPIACWSDVKEDGAFLRIYGTNWQGRELRSPEGVPGIAIPILPSSPEVQPARTAEKIGRITALVKPVTQGHVEVMAFDEVSEQYTWLSRLGQHETAPSLTRYFLSGVDVKHPVAVKARVSLQFTPLYALDDISLIQHREVYRLMAQALRGFDANDGALGHQFQERAIRILKDAVGKSTKGQRIALNVTNTNRPIRSGDRYSIRRFR